MESSGDRPLDRRQRKSRAALRDALLALVAEKAYGEITIEDIAERADVARATFYAHYKDGSALLYEVTRELVSELAERLAVIAPQTAVVSGAGMTAIFEHADAHPDLYQLVLSGEGGPAVRRELVTAFERVSTTIFSNLADASPSPPRSSIPASSTAVVGALLLTLETWLGRQDREDPRTTAVEFLRQQLGGLEWALGFDPGQTNFESLMPRPQ